MSETNNNNTQSEHQVGSHLVSTGMKYILDFDKVIFNTPVLKQKMAELGIGEDERGLDVFDRITEADPTFDFKDLVFPGALELIQEYGQDCFIVSSASSETVENNTDLEAQLAFQREKIMRSGVMEYIDEKALRVVGVEKNEALAEVRDVLKAQGETFVFVDDRERYIREARELGIPAVWMDREQAGYLKGPEGVPTMLEFPRVGSFAELRELIQSWNQKEE
tara:strand:- start:4967 stop:5632 length:666 start_codon:yes stop_codon:yes gene_type:complete